MTRRALHFVFKIGDRKETAKFYRDILEMKFLRHEEFEEGCDAACNGPYDGKWSKSMVGYGSEDDHFVVELTYNYGIGNYRLGNDFKSLTIQNENVLKHAKDNGYEIHTDSGLSYVMSPDGHRFMIRDEKSVGDCVKRVSLSCSNIERSVGFWSELLGMKVKEMSTDHVILSYNSSQCELELSHTTEPIDRASGYGRIAFSCPSTELPDIERMMKERGESILKPLVHLDTPGKATVSVVILGDPDGHEICFVGEEAFKELSKVDIHADDLLNQAMANDKSDEWFAKKGRQKESA